MVEKKKTERKSYLTAGQTIAQNRRARYDYALEDFTEAGLQLTGSEVKSLRQGQVSIAEAYIGDVDGELHLINATIQEYPQSPAHLQHKPKRSRKLLLHKKEIGKFMGAVARSGYSILPTKLYFNKRNIAKLEIALGKGKKLHDKRDTEKQRDWSRDKARILKG